MENKKIYALKIGVADFEVPESFVLLSSNFYDSKEEAEGIQKFLLDEYDYEVAEDLAEALGLDFEVPSFEVYVVEIDGNNIDIREYLSAHIWDRIKELIEDEESEEE